MFFTLCSREDREYTIRIGACVAQLIGIGLKKKENNQFGLSVI